MLFILWIISQYEQMTGELLLPTLRISQWQELNNFITGAAVFFHNYFSWSFPDFCFPFGAKREEDPCSLCCSGDTPGLLYHVKPLENAIKISPFLLGNLRELNGRAVFFWQLGQSLKSLKFNFLLFLQDIPRCKRGVPAIARAPRVAGPGRGPVLGSRSPHCCAPQKFRTPGPPRTHVRLWPRPLPRGAPPARQGAWRGAASPPLSLW